MEKMISHLKYISSIITLHESGNLQLGTEEWSLIRGEGMNSAACPWSPGKGQGRWVMDASVAKIR